ncbi:MAG: phytanoyl-CoA dioxygenase family protein [Fuerstiella sp.]|nr:phytanoyl-CoA dioxygenase family protein [Fuerstiella sp.]
MQLNESQISQFDQQGYLFFPELLDTDEVTALQKAVPDVLDRRGPEIVCETDDPTAVRLAFGAHTYSDAFRHLVRLPRLLNPVRRLLDNDVYLHQSRLNPKNGFGGGASWDWHQDYPPWNKIDGMPEPMCIMAAVFIDDCSVARSPLLIVPGSQRHGLLDSEPHPDTTGKEYALHHIDHVTLKSLAADNGIEALVGPAGSVAFVHCNVVHGSANNVSPWQRAIMYLIYNAVNNACTGTDRAWYHNNRDFSPLLPLDDDCLKTLAE